jgi:hypothetical protein
MNKCWVILLALTVGACSSKKDKFSDLFARGKSLGQVE